MHIVLPLLAGQLLGVVRGGEALGSVAERLPPLAGDPGVAHLHNSTVQYIILHYSTVQYDTVQRTCTTSPVLPGTLSPDT